MNIPVTDIVIIMVCLAACGYCALLNKRLKALQNTKDGLGATIVALSKSVSTMTNTTDQTRRQAGEFAERLASLLADADRMCERVAAQNQKMSETHSEVSTRVAEMHSELESSMYELLGESKERIIEMTALLRQIQIYMQKSSNSNATIEAAHAPSNNPRPEARHRYEY